MGHFRAELKESSQVLSEILGAGEIPTSSAVTLTPQLIDDELPVLPSSTNKQSSVVPSIRTVNSSFSSNKTTSSSVRTSIPHSNSTSNHRHVHASGGNGVQSHSHNVHGTGTGSHSHSHASANMEEGVDGQGRHVGGVKQGMRGSIGVKRRRWSVEQGPPLV